jgi:hypothetical protein
MPPKGYAARRLLALASGELGRADEAAAALLASREELGDWPLEGGLDPLAADFDRSLAELALLRGEAAVAASALRRLADAEAETMGEARTRFPTAADLAERSRPGASAHASPVTTQTGLPSTTPGSSVLATFPMLPPVRVPS